jgi:predicted membrane protein
LPIAIIGTGLSMILSAIFVKRKMKSDFKKLGLDGENIKVNYTVFSGADINCRGEVFEGASLCAVFGGIDVDLRGAIIEKDCTILATVAFGGIDIIVPDDVNVKINSSVYFGGVSDDCENRVVDNAPTLYINCTGAFGGIDIMNREDD